MSDGGGARERQRQLLSVVRKQGRVDVSAAARQLAVAPETVRRDLRALEEHGLVKRSYGAAYPVERAGFETDLQWRQGDHVPEKQAVAAEAARHLDDAETVFIDEGFTPQLIAANLAFDRPLTVVTASLPVAAVAAEHDDVTVILLGGLVRGRTLATVEHWAIRMLADFVIDLAYIGANGISLLDGLTTPDPRVAAVKSAAMRCSRRRIFSGVSEKFGVASFCRFADVADFELLITDRHLPASVSHQYAAAGISLIRV